MKRKMSAFLVALICTLSLAACGAAQPANSTAEAPSVLPVEVPEGLNKGEFAAYVSRLDAPGPSLTREEADLLLVEYALSADDRLELEGKLNAAGYYIYRAGGPTEEGADSLIMGGAVCTYCPEAEEWTLMSGGVWAEPEQFKDENLKGFDEVGLSIQGEGEVPRLAGSNGIVWSGEETLILENASEYDTSKGTGFEFQDEWRDGHFRGEKFACFMRFGHDFEAWSGTVQGKYTHTSAVKEPPSLTMEDGTIRFRVTLEGEVLAVTCLGEKMEF